MPAPVASKAAVDFSEVVYPKVLTETLGALVNQATVITTAELGKILLSPEGRPIGFLGHVAEEPGKMPAPFIRAKEADFDISGFVVRVAPVNKPLETKLVTIFQRWYENPLFWHATAPNGLLPESTLMEKSHFERFALLAKGEKVIDKDGVEWQKV